MTNIYELIGVIIGDGSILYNPKKYLYRLEIAGNYTEDYKYFLKLSQIILEISGNKPKIRFREHKLGRSITLYIDNKNFVEYLINELQLPYGKKTFSVKIPDKFLSWRYSRHIIRGIFESDGCLYFSKSKVNKYPTYPRIEIRTSSDKLKEQIVTILKNKKFNVQTLKLRTNKIYLSGEFMLKKWLNEIGINNPKNISKYLIWKKQGYYVPKCTLNERENLLNSNLADLY
ncbi:MAG: hypothetical protein AABY07_08940 [Nanoarchaeota archaeon]